MQAEQTAALEAQAGPLGAWLALHAVCLWPVAPAAPCSLPPRLREGSPVAGLSRPAMSTCWVSPVWHALSDALPHLRGFLGPFMVPQQQAGVCLPAGVALWPRIDVPGICRCGGVGDRRGLPSYRGGRKDV